MARDSGNDGTQKFIEAIGAMGEMTLLFYRTVTNAGASSEEAFNLTRAFIAATLAAGAKD